MEPLLFSLILSLLLVHEMDAIRAREWKLFIFLKDMAEEAAYRIFTIIHLPLYCAALYALSIGGTASRILKLVIDIFILAHTVLHCGFRKHKDNGFKAGFSKLIIYAMPLFAVLHLLLLYLL